jgi:hypothetical protein
VVSLSCRPNKLRGGSVCGRGQPRMHNADNLASVSDMHWLTAHQALVETVGLAVVALVAIAMMIALRRVLRQGRRAMFGAHPVIGPPEFSNASDGGLVLVVPFANAAAEPATRFSARVKADGVAGGAPKGSVTLFGYGAEPDANRVRIAFDWPVGILDADVVVSWTWRDASGAYDGRWHGHLRVPQPEMPPDMEVGSAASDPLVETTSGPADPGSGKPGTDPVPVATKPRIDPLSRIRGGTAKAPKRPESGQ